VRVRQHVVDQKRIGIIESCKEPKKKKDKNDIFGKSQREKLKSELICRVLISLFKEKRQQLYRKKKSE